MKLYLIGSLRNESVPEIAARLREGTEYEIFDDWYAAGPEADDYWQKYELKKGHSYAEALQGYAANHVFEFDKHHLDTSDVCVLVLPAGRSGHLELGYFLGTGKPGFILLDGSYKEEGRFDVMYRFATGVFEKEEDLLNGINSLPRRTEGEGTLVSDPRAFSSMPVWNK